LPQTVYLYISTGTSSGPYSVYINSISLGNRIETNLTLAQLQAGRMYSIPDNSDTTLIVTNDNAYCGNSQSLTVLAVSPTPTPTPSITATPSVTPSVTVSPSITPSITVTPSNTASPSVTPSITPSVTTSPIPTPSITPSTTVPVTGIIVKLTNDVDTACLVPDSTVYLSSANYATYISNGYSLSPGMILYYDAYLSSVISGYLYVNDDVVTRNLNSTTGVVGGIVRSC
jgi:hypothetical protein